MLKTAAAASLAASILLFAAPAFAQGAAGPTPSIQAKGSNQGANKSSGHMSHKMMKKKKSHKKM